MEETLSELKLKYHSTSLKPSLRAMFKAETFSLLGLKTL